LLASGAIAAAEILPPILISGVRTVEPGLDIPAATTIISQEEIRNSSASNLDELLRRVSSIHVSDGTGGGGNSRIDMRGFGSAAPSNVAVLLNGRKINPASDGAALYLNSIDLENVAQIEIIEGSAGILFGNQAVGGLINIITERPDRQSRRASASAGSYDSYAVSATLNEPFTNGGGFQLEGEYAESDNYRDRNASRVTRINSRLDFDNAGGTNRVELQLLDDYLQTPGALFADELAADRRQAVFPGDYQDTQSRVLLLGTQQKLNDHWQLEGELSLRDDQREFVQSFRGFAGSLSTQDRDAVEFTPRLIGRFDGTVYTIGFDQLTTDYLLVTAFGPQGNDQQIQALYGQVTHPLSDRTSITTGIRHAQVDNDIDNGGTPVTLDDDVTVGSLGLVFKPDERWRLYARADQNYRFAKVDEHTNVPFGQPVGLDNQTGISYETGASFTGPKAQVSVNAYLLELEDEISFDASSFFNINLPETRRRGLTTSLDFSGNGMFGGGIGYSYVDSEITSGPFTGNEVPLVPAHRVSAYLGARPSSDTSVRLDLEYVSEQFLGGDFNNTSPELDAYTVVDLVAHRDFDAWRLTFKVNNLLDEQYSESGAASFSGDGFNPAPERNFWVGLSYSTDG
jgi:iron complex outermembrane receptor protein